jgi:hypothetical protein
LLSSLICFLPRLALVARPSQHASGVCPYLSARVKRKKGGPKAAPLIRRSPSLCRASQRPTLETARWTSRPRRLSRGQPFARRAQPRKSAISRSIAVCNRANRCRQDGPILFSVDPLMALFSGPLPSLSDGERIAGRIIAAKMGPPRAAAILTLMFMLAGSEGRGLMRRRMRFCRRSLSTRLLNALAQSLSGRCVLPA